MNILNNSVIIGLISAALYFFGYMQDLTFLRDLNFPTAQFIKKPEELIQDGFLVVFLGPAIIEIVYFVSALVGVSALLFILGQRIEFFRKIRVQYNEYVKKYGRIVFFLFLFIPFYQSVIYATDWGSFLATSLLEKPKGYSQVVHFSSHDRPPIKGKLIRVSPILYGFLNYDNKTTLLIKRDIVDMVISEKWLMDIKPNEVNPADAKKPRG